MLRIFITFITFFMLFFNVSGVEISKSTPIKIAHLTEAARITDEDGDFAFKRPRRIKIAPDGSVFVAGRNKLLKFTPQGKFVKNFIKKGEGPGEVKYFSNFFFGENGIVIGSYMPVKLIFADLEGIHNREFRIHKVQPFTQFIHMANDRFYFQVNKVFGQDLKTGINQRVREIVFCDPQGKIHQTGLKFITYDAVIKQSIKGRIYLSIDEITSLISVFDADKNDFYVSHKARYEIIRHDLKTNKILGSISRPYEPVPFRMKKGLDKEDIKIEKVKNRKHFNDIYALRFYDGKLLVFTSTMDKNNRILVDVFNPEGEYIDKFFLKIPQVERPNDLSRKPMCFHKDFFWTTSLDEDENPYIIKYKFDF